MRTVDARRIRVCPLVPVETAAVADGEGQP